MRFYFLRRLTAPQHTRFILPLTSPDKIIAALRGRYFSLWELYLENFMSRPDVISTFLSTPLQNRGRNFVRSKRCPHHMSRAPPLIVCVLTIWKQLPRNGFERSGRGQESSRGHKFSIPENFLPLWDSFLLGRACPKPCCLLSENHAPLGPRELTLIGGTEL